jgi:uncharacterized DUF497 family protein
MSFSTSNLTQATFAISDNASLPSRQTSSTPSTIKFRDQEAIRFRDRSHGPFGAVLPKPVSLTTYTLVVYLECVEGQTVAGEAEGTEFEWDDGNADKNWERHRVSWAECEEVFFNRPLVVAADQLHSETELRFYALGQTDAGRLLFVVYTLRGERIRVISARDMTRREKKGYDHARTQELAADPDV